VSVLAEQVSDVGAGGLPNDKTTARMLVPREIATETVWFEALTPAVTWKLVVVAPDETVAETGRVSMAVELAATVKRTPPAGAGLEMTAVQVVEAKGSKMVVLQAREETTNGAVTVSAVVVLTPAKVAVMVEVWSEVTGAAVTVKMALVAFDAIATVAGTVMLPVAVNAILAPAAAELFKVTVQAATAPGASDDGVHESPLRSEVTTVVAIPPVGLMLICPPASDAPREPETPIGAEFAPFASVTETLATMPLAMRLVLMPVARQV